MSSAGNRAILAVSLLSLVLGTVVTAVTGDRLAVALLFVAVFAFATLSLGITATAGVGDRVALLGASGSPRAVPSGSFGPMLVGLCAGVLVLGAALGIVAYAFGAALVGFGAVVWFSSVWREHPLYTPKVSTRVSNSVGLPFGMPLAVLALIGLVAISMSRAFLAASKTGSALVAILVALMFLVGGIVAAALPKRTSRSTFIAVVALFLLAVVGLGVAGLVKGERDFEHHGETQSETEQAGTAET